MANRTPIAKLRRQILGNRGVKPIKKTKRLVPVHEYPDSFPKTTKMKMLEYKYHIKLEVVLFNGSLSDVVQFLNGEVDKSTISKWRKRYMEHTDETNKPYIPEEDFRHQFSH